jgi:hypothetical protein
MSNFGKTVIIDTGFWIAFYNARDQYHVETEKKADLLETSTILVPWPSLYETFNSRFAKNTLAARHFEKLLRQTHVVRLSDEPYRESALEVAIAGVNRRCYYEHCTLKAPGFLKVRDKPLTSGTSLAMNVSRSWRIVSE